MIINKDILECKDCKKMYFFDSSKPYSKFCLKCGGRLIYIDNADCDTDRAEAVKNQPKYDPTKDPSSPAYIPKVECPYCHSTNVTRISNTERVASIAMLGIFSKKINKNFKCNSCKATF